MKRVVIILTVLLSTTVNQNLKAKNSGSGGSALPLHHSFELPSAVVVSLSNHFGHFDLIHTKRTHRRNRLQFDMVIQHGSNYIEVSVGDNGRYYGETYYDYYPLGNHYCDEYCSFQYQHYENDHFANYDPYNGCSVHVSLMLDRHSRFVYRPYYGYGSLHYNPQYRIYKRFRPYHIPGDYYVHRSRKYHPQPGYHHHPNRQRHRSGSYYKPYYDHRSHNDYAPTKKSAKRKKYLLDQRSDDKRNQQRGHDDKRANQRYHQYRKRG